MANVKKQQVTKVTENISGGVNGTRFTGKVRDGSPYAKIYKGIGAFSQSIKLHTLAEIRNLRDALNTVIEESDKEAEQ